MKTMKKIVLQWLICSALFLLPLCTAGASDTLLPSASSNLQFKLRRQSNIVATDDGYMRVYYTGKQIGIEYYDNQFVIKSKKSLPMELELWGGFYAGENAYYLVEGQANTAQSDTAEVIRVIKYSTSWQRLGAATITGNTELFGGEVRYPFDYGCVEMAESGGTLYVVTGHEGYVDSFYGQGHQGFLMIAVDEASMTGKIVDCDLWHSFAQYIKSKDSNLYVLEQSEGSRCATLTKYDTVTMQRTLLNIFQYGGSRDSAWAIPCYASVDGMAVSSDHILSLGTSIDQSNYDSISYDTAYNIYLSVTPLSNFSEEATQVKWLTNHKNNGKSFYGAKITRINDNRFMVSWEEWDSDGTDNIDDSLSAGILHYVFVDGKGDKISPEYTESASLSDCQPIVKNSRVTYYAANGNMVNFYSIDPETGKTDKKSYRVAGENASWNYLNGVLTLSGTGEIQIPQDSDSRRPPVWKSVKEQTRKIIIQKGITGISDESLSCFPNVEEIVIEPGLQTIGAKAFYGCGSLSKITIPASVKKIGDDILWTGYYWVSDGSHVVHAAIYTEPDSFAADYAKKNSIFCLLDLSKAKLGGIKKTYVYTGKKLEPAVTVKTDKKTLKKDRDYSVSYKKNTDIGTASVTITGTGDYTGKITRTFQITAPAKGNTFTDSKTKNCYLVTSSKHTVAFAGTKAKNKTSVTIPGTVKFGGTTYRVTSIAASAFKNNRTLKKVTIGSSITEIGAKAFYGCKKLAIVTLGKNVASIEASAFENCTALKKLTLPAKVKKLGTKAFYNCTCLTSMTLKTAGLTSKTIGSKAFGNVGKTNYRKTVIKVPKAKVSSYKKLFVKRGLSPKAKVTK